MRVRKEGAKTSVTRVGSGISDRVMRRFICDFLVGPDKFPALARAHSISKQISELINGLITSMLI